MNETTTTITTVAAQPGWFIATLGDDELEFDPIVAWEIKRTAPTIPLPGCTGEWAIRRGVTPIALNDNDFRSQQCWAIKSPDGKFDIPGDCICDDEATALKRLQRKCDNTLRADITTFVDKVGLDNATEALLSGVTDPKQRDDMRRLFHDRDRWNGEGRRVDLDEYDEHIRAIEITMLADEVFETANEKDNFDLEVDVKFFLDERGYEVTERLIDEVLSQARQRIEKKQNAPH